MIVKRVEELANLGAMLVAEFGKLLGDIADLAGDHRPAVAGKPG